MLVPWRTLNGRHPSTAQCARGTERKRQRLAEEEFRENTEKAFEAYGAPLENVTVFKYMGLVITAGGDDWPAVVGNLQKERESWGSLSRILILEGVDPVILGYFFKSHSLASLSHSICRFIIIATHVGASLRYPIGITLHHIFPPGVNTVNISCVLYSTNTFNNYCPYPLQ